MKKTISLAQLAKLTNCKLVGDPSYIIHGVADLETATPSDASFLSNDRYSKQLEKSSAGVIFVASDFSPSENKNYLLSNNPSSSFQQALEYFFSSIVGASAFLGVHESAYIHESVTLGKNVTISPFVVIDQNTTIGDNTFIGPGVSIGPGVTIGNDCYLHPNVTIRENCTLRNRVILQPGVVIGSCGFGYTQDEKYHHKRLKQLGSVVIEDDVEIGANTTIDRARFKETIISKGTKVDNLVQIAHGASIGDHSLIIAQTGIAGSAKIGKHVIIAGQVGVMGHLSVSDYAMVAGKSLISKSITKPGKYGGNPTRPLNEHQRRSVYLNKIQTYAEKINKSEKRLATLEKRLAELELENCK